jgi:hypothetical protein
LKIQLLQENTDHKSGSTQAEPDLKFKQPLTLNQVDQNQNQIFIEAICDPQSSLIQTQIRSRIPSWTNTTGKKRRRYDNKEALKRSVRPRSETSRWSTLPRVSRSIYTILPCILFWEMLYTVNTFIGRNYTIEDLKR